MWPKSVKSFPLPAAHTATIDSPPAHSVGWFFLLFLFVPYYSLRIALSLIISSFPAVQCIWRRKKNTKSDKFSQKPPTGWGTITLVPLCVHANLWIVEMSFVWWVEDLHRPSENGFQQVWWTHWPPQAVCVSRFFTNHVQQLSFPRSVTIWKYFRAWFVGCTYVQTPYVYS